MPIIKTKEDWWNALNKHWANIFDIMWKYLPMSVTEKIKDGEVVPNGTIALGQTIERLKTNQNPEICRYLFAAWDAAPDREYIHSNPSWGVLCDLLSEEWVLNE